jgi:hypothetical protein
MASRLEYSARKMKLNYTEGYSVFYPATNSASASDKSNGALFVSAEAMIT